MFVKSHIFLLITYEKFNVIKVNFNSICIKLILITTYCLKIILYDYILLAGSFLTIRDIRSY